MHTKNSRKDNTILITGSSGRLGSAIAESLSNYYSIIGIDIRPGRYTTSIMDIRSSDILYLIKKVNYVIHTAALHAPHVGIYDDRKFWDINVQGTKNLLLACIKNKVSRFVFTSSTSIYGKAMVHSEKTVWVTETIQPQPRDIYDITKIEGEELCREVMNNSGLSCLCLRVSRCFPEDPRLMAIYRLYRGIDIQDVALAFKLAITAPVKNFEIMNISSQSPFNLTELNILYKNADHAIVKHYPQVQTIFQNRGWSLPQSIDRIYVIEKAKGLLGFHPVYNFIEFLTRIEHESKYLTQ